MLRIRMIEEEIAKRYHEGEMRCPVHLSIGQEAAAVGVAASIKPSDKMVSTHRSHAHYLAKGGSLNGLIGELYGKSSGCSRGNGGSMHLIDLDVNFYGSTSIVGGTIPVGVGLAFADRIKGCDSATVVCIGDAATEEGVFHEAANFASLHKLKVVFVCENNLYSCFTRIEKRQPDRRLGDVAKAHRLNYFHTKPNDVTDIVFQMKVARMFAPSFIEIPTYRTLQHCGPDNDDNLGYRSADEIEMWKDLDALKINQPTIEGFQMDMAKAKIQREIVAAFDNAKFSLPPDPQEIGAYVYKNP